MGKTVVITQSNYIPWRGYFDLCRAADEVILLDTVQFTRRDWRNRNRIKTPNGLAWLTIPVEVKGRFHQAIDETRVADPGWTEMHQRAIETAYRNAKHYDEIAPWFLKLLDDLRHEELLTAINEHLIRALCERLGIEVSIRRCTEFVDREASQNMRPTERLAAIAAAAAATRYLSGPAARDYMELELFAATGIEVAWMSYEGYPEYPQLWGAFEPRVSIIDVLLNTGSHAPCYLDRTIS